ncbi:hypothetical protein KAR91_08630 [Candidatus Pacearchaeota archaeon]|nr:hypothetical protein [Candidatus Pacearchaeota archaeon]
MNELKRKIKLLEKELDIWKKTYETVTDPGLRESLQLEFMKKATMLLEMREELPEKKTRARKPNIKYD